jgi:hypothetical protein
LGVPVTYLTSPHTLVYNVLVVAYTACVMPQNLDIKKGVLLKSGALFPYLGFHFFLPLFIQESANFPPMLFIKTPKLDFSFWRSHTRRGSAL